MTAPAGPGETVDRGAVPVRKGQQPGESGDGRDHRGPSGDRVVPETAPGKDNERPAAGHDEDLDQDPATRQDPQVAGKERLPPDPSLIVAHGARSLLVTGLVVIMTLAAIALAPHVHAHVPWTTIAGAYTAAALLVFLRCRSAASGGIVPLGTLGDSRFMLAVVAAVGLAAIPAASAYAAIVPATLLLVAAGMCGMADGAWIAMAQRHLNLTFFQALRTFLRAARTGDATTWRIVGGRP